MGEPLGTRAVMERLWQYAHKLLAFAVLIAEGCSREREEVGEDEYVVCLMRDPRTLELAKPIVDDKLDWQTYPEWAHSDDGLGAVAACNSLDELEPDLRRFIEWIVPWFLSSHPECEGAECTKGWETVEERLHPRKKAARKRKETKKN